MEMRRQQYDAGVMAGYESQLQAQEDAGVNWAANLIPRMSKYCPHIATERQTCALLLNDYLELFFGGAAGGGKSDYLLMAALQYIDVPGYNALILRRTFSQLNMADSILHRAHQWLQATDAQWEGKHNRYVFPAGSSIQFGYLQHENDKYQYDSAAFQFIGFDELSQFLESQYTFLFGRLRKPVGFPVPLRMRGASNPGGVGHLWSKKRFIEKSTVRGKSIFIPSLLEDNPHIDQVAYEESLSMLDPITRAQRRWGDWNASLEGALFKFEWFQNYCDIAAVPFECSRMRFWDLAGTEAKKKSTNPDWTVGVRVAMAPNGIWYIEDVRRDRLSPLRVEELVSATAKLDGRNCRIRMEQEPGASGKTVIAQYLRQLVGYDFAGICASGPKYVRWRPFAAQAEGGNVTLVNGPWNHEWLQEICSVTQTMEHEHDDQADATSGAFNTLALEPAVEYGVSRLGGGRRQR